jgi:large conductance mechanosensitive channel
MSLNTEVSSVVKGSLGFVGEFKQFIARGNVVDLAVGVIIGGAFGNIVNSLVKDVVMPPIGLLTSGHDFSSIGWVLQKAVTAPDPTDPAKFVVVKPEVAIEYGAFLNTVVSFLIVSFVVFLIVIRPCPLPRRSSSSRFAICWPGRRPRGCPCLPG